MMEKGNFRKMVLVIFLLMVTTVQVYAQRIIGYFPNYNYTAANATNVQYTKLTHLFYFSLNPVETSWGQSDGNLWYNDSFSWFTTAYFNDVIAKAKAANPNIKIIIVTGGAPGGDGGLSARLEYIGSSASLRNKFCNNIIAFIVANNLDGWDLDWEFPETASARTAHQNLLARMRIKIDSLKTARCKHYELSIAVGGGYTDVTSPRTCWGAAHNDFLNAATIASLDFINIMAYDGNIGSPPCSFSSHQHYDLMVKAFNDWRTAFPTLPASKINMGVGFYGNGFVNFNTIGNVSTRYNDPAYWPTGGSGCTNLQSKINYMRTNGMAGIMIWEITQDNLCAGGGGPPTCYSLLHCIHAHITSTWGTWTAPSGPCALDIGDMDINGNSLNNSEQKAMNVEVTPNPFERSFTITKDNSTEEELFHVQIQDLAGQVWYEAKATSVNGITQIEGDFPPGVYICSVTTGKERRSLKIVKTR
jgi:chitinase